MRTISALALFAALGLVAAGCASGSKVPTGSVTGAVTTTISKVKTGSVISSKAFSASITVSGTTTLSKVKTGTVVRCKGSQLTAAVPGRSEGVVESGRSSSGAGSQQMGVTRLLNGAVAISCKP